MRQQLLALPLAILALSAVPMLGDNHDKKTDVTITEAVQVPGGTVLPPGNYVFILNNSASNRNIVEIRSEDGKHLYAMVFTTRATRTQQTSHTVLTFYEMPAGQPPALRQWFWPGDYDGQQFLYPRSEAARIDQADTQRQRAPEVSDQDYSNLQDRGFSTRYPETSSGNYGQSTVNSANPQPEPSVPTGRHAVGDNGAHGGSDQDLPGSH